MKRPTDIKLADKPNLPNADEVFFDHEEWMRHATKAERNKAHLHEQMTEDALKAWRTVREDIFHRAIAESPNAALRSFQALLPKTVNIDIKKQVKHEYGDSVGLQALKDLTDQARTRLRPPVTIDQAPDDSEDEDLIGD